MIEDGIILVDKPAGITSFGVVARIRRQLSVHFSRKMKVGHTGTLDPFATGLMILVVGKECKKASSYSKLDKIYEATIRLGEVSTTADPEGEITIYPGLSSKNIPDSLKIKDVLNEFVGEITQTPPQYSAIKVNGKRAYKLARAGTPVAIPERKITVFSLELIEYTYPTLKIRAHVSSGTYIRTLAEDIGIKLKTGAYCKGLRRTTIGAWKVSDSNKEINITI